MYVAIFICAIRVAISQRSPVNTRVLNIGSIAHKTTFIAVYNAVVYLTTCTRRINCITF